MPKRDLGKALGGGRFKTSETVEVRDPLAEAASALQQKAEASPDAVTQEGTQSSTEASIDARMHARTNEHMQGDVPASTQASTHVGTQTSMQERKPARKTAGTPKSRQSSTGYIGRGITIDTLYEQIQQRKHLANGSFRYQADELETLDAIFEELHDQKPGRISKNDLARMALIAFCEDYQRNGDESVLAQVFKRM